MGVRISESAFNPTAHSPKEGGFPNQPQPNVYDGENRLVQVSDCQLTWKFLYDPLGRRIRQKLSGWYFSYYAQGWTNELLYHSQLVYDEGWHPIYEQVLGGQNTSHRYKYYWGPYISGSYGGAGGIGGLLMMHRSNINKSYTVGYDGNGNVLNMIDLSDGSVDATFEYDAFGQIVRETGDSWRMPFRHQTKWSTAYAPTSKLMGSSTATMAAPRIKIDLYDYGLRWYHPNFGRFVNRDPIGEAGGINLYAFVGNDPVNRWDMLGMVCYVLEDAEEYYQIAGGEFDYDEIIDSERYEAWITYTFMMENLCDDYFTHDPFLDYDDYYLDDFWEEERAQGGDSWTEGSVISEAQRQRDMYPDILYIRAPESLIGDPLYYVFRYHAAPDEYRKGKGKEYFLDYGYKYALKFTQLGENATSLSMELFVFNTRIELQLAIEDTLTADPTIAADRSRLYQAAFDSHDAAYRRGGFDILTFSEQLTVGRLVDLRDFLSQDALLEIWQTRDMWGGTSVP